MLADHRNAKRSFDDNTDDDDESEDEQRSTTRIPSRQRLPSIIHENASKKRKRHSTRMEASNLENPPTTENSTSVISQIDLVDNAPTLSATTTSSIITTSASSSSTLRELTNNVIQFRKQMGELTKSYTLHQKTLEAVLKNQKKLAKAMRIHKVSDNRSFVYELIFYWFF